MCCLCWTWQGAQTPLVHDVGQEQASLASGHPGGLRERHGNRGVLASLPGPCRPLGRLRSRSSDTWMPRQDGTTSISGFPQPVKSWHMVISILCVDVCIPGILHTSFTDRASIEAQATAIVRGSGSSSYAGPRPCAHKQADLPGTSTVPVGTCRGWQAGPTCEVLAAVLQIGFANRSPESHTECFLSKGYRTRQVGYGEGGRADTIE